MTRRPVLELFSDVRRGAAKGACSASAGLCNSSMLHRTSHRAGGFFDARARKWRFVGEKVVVLMTHDTQTVERHFGSASLSEGPMMPPT